jgi:quinol monooxygenase YgiN
MNPDKALLTRMNHLITLTIHVRPPFLSRMRLMAHDLVAMSRTEDGCILFFAAESREIPGLFLITSAWRDTESYDRHRASPYVRAFESQIVPEILLEPVSFRAWQKLG